MIVQFKSSWVVKIGLMLLLATLFLVACNSSSETASDRPTQLGNADMEVDTYRELPSCVEKREGKSAYVVDQDQMYVCKAGEWIEDEIVVESSSSEEKLFRSSSSLLPTFPTTNSAASFGISGSLYDSRDGKTYRTVIIGTQKWMAENLNFKTDTGSVCFRHNLDSCAKYGRYYTWAAAMGLPEDDFRQTPVGTVRGACPAGWHVPTFEEWDTLSLSMARSPYAMQAVGFENWTKAADIFGFSVVPANAPRTATCTVESLDSDSPCYKMGFRDVGSFAYFWSATSADVMACQVWVSADGTFVESIKDAEADVSSVKTSSYSVRCINDTSFASTFPSNTLSQSADPVTDSRDGKIYRTVTIGSQIWMAENLNYVTNTGSKCYWNEPDSCAKYGRFYNWATAVGMPEGKCGEGNECDLVGPIQGVCPDGWHLPSYAEWHALLFAVGGAGIAGSKLKSETCWTDSNGDNCILGEDAFGFSALPTGLGGNGSLDKPIGFGSWAFFWSSLEGIALQLKYDQKNAETVSYGTFMLPVRCLKN